MGAHRTESGPSTRMNKHYQNTRFLKSTTSLQGMPEGPIREVAFAGRSNAGKSSAINRICQQKSLARTSKTPGRTQQINFFIVEDDRYLVDLPGYGYARVAKAQQQQWGNLLRMYLTRRPSLTGLILLMDIRHPLTPLDNQLLELCREGNIPIQALLTKSDKLKRGAARATLHDVTQRLERLGLDARVQLFSSLQGEGVETAQACLDEWLGFEHDRDATDVSSRPEALI